MLCVNRPLLRGVTTSPHTAPSTSCDGGWESSEQRRLRLKCNVTRAETRFRLSAKQTSPFKSAGASVQSTTGSRGVRISDSNAGYTMFQSSVTGTGYPIHSPVSPSLPPVSHRVPSRFNRTPPQRTAASSKCEPEPIQLFPRGIHEVSIPVVQISNPTVPPL
jgi:hypothetical protein